MATVDTLQVRITADMKDLKRSLKEVERNTKQSTENMSNSFRKLGRVVKVVAGAVIVRELGRGAIAAVNFAADIEEMQAKSSVVFGAFAGDVRRQLSVFADEVGRSRFELEGMASSIQDTFVPLGFARGEASQLSVQLTKLATDVASFNNASDVDTMRAFQSALVGNHETVRRFGIVITEATLEQELFRMGITKAKDEVSNAEKVQARLNLILAGTTDAHGDAARTADSFANRQKALKAATDELMNSLGQIFMPLMSKIQNRLIDAATAANDFLIKLGLVGDKIGEIRLQKLKDELADVTTEMSKLGDVSDGVGDDLVLFGNVTSEGETRLFELQTRANALSKLIKQIEEERTRLGRNEVNEKKVEDAKPKDETLTKSQIKANEDLKQSIEDVRFENQLLEAQMRGASEADLEIMRLRKEHQGTNEEQLSFLVEETRLRQALQQQIEDEIEASKLQQEQALLQVQKEKEQLDLLRELGMANQDFSAEMQTLKEALEGGTITTDQYNEALARLNIKIFESTEAGGILMEGLNRTMDSLSTTMADSLMGMGEGWKGFRDSLKGIVRDIIAQFIKVQMQALITRSIAGMGGGGGMFSSIGNLFGGGSGGSGGGAPTPSYGFAQTGATGVHSRSPYVVGERGPELFVPNTSGSIMSNAQSRKISGGGGVTVNQTLNFDVGVAQTVRSEILQLMPTIKQQSVDAVIDAKERGGRMADVFK